MAIVVTTQEGDVIGKNRMVCGTLTADATTSAAVTIGLSKIKSIQLCPSPAAAVAVSGGEITFAPAEAGVIQFTAIGE